MHVRDLFFQFDFDQQFICSSSMIVFLSSCLFSLFLSICIRQSHEPSVHSTALSSWLHSFQLRPRHRHQTPPSSSSVSVLITPTLSSASFSSSSSSVQRNGSSTPLSLELFCIPAFLLPHAADILTAGKTLRLLLTLEQVRIFISKALSQWSFVF